MTEVLNPARAVEDVAALLQRSRLDEAVDLARQALDSGIEAPLLLNLRAYWLEQQKRPADALADLQKAHALAPADPMVLNALGLCLAKMGRMEDALAAFRDCAALAPQFGPAHFNSGWTLEEMGELDGAQKAFEEAARISPDSPDPLSRLATLAVRRGQWAAARAAAEKALALAPGHPAAAIALASAEIAEKSFAAARRRLGALVETPNIPDQDRATAVGLLGDILDAEGRYPEAFVAYSTSNAVFKVSLAERLAARSEIPMSEYVGWLLESFDSASMPHWPTPVGTVPSADDAPAGHIFLMGFPRSGTTLLEEVLACHPTVTTTGEWDAFSEIVRDLLAGPAQLERLKSLTPDDAARQRARYWSALRRHGIETDGRTLLDKQPFNTIRLPLIAKLFPEAKILFALRDPRDVVLSCFRRRFSLNAANVEFLTLEGTAQLYDAVMRLAFVYREKLPLTLQEVRHEELVEDFDGRLRSLCAFLGIDWVDEFRDFAGRSTSRQVSTPSATQIQRGLGRDGIGHWRRYKPDLAPVLTLLNGWAKRLNYMVD